MPIVDILFCTFELGGSYPHGFGPQAWLTSQMMGCMLLTQLETGMPLQPVMDPMTMIAVQ